MSSGKTGSALILLDMLTKHRCLWQLYWALKLKEKFRLYTSFLNNPLVKRQVAKIDSGTLLD